MIERLKKLVLVAAASVAVAVVALGTPAVPRALANPANIYVVNLNVATALNGGTAVTCTPASANTSAQNLAAWQTASAGQISSDPNAGSVCIFVKTDGSQDPVTFNPRGLTLGATSGPTAGTNGTFAAAAITGVGSFQTGNAVDVIEDAVLIPTGPLTLVSQPNNFTLALSKTVLSAGAPSCALTDSTAASTNAVALATYTDVNGHALVGYPVTFGPLFGAFGTNAGVANTHAVSMVRTDGVTIAAYDVVCGQLQGTQTIGATAPAGVVAGVTGDFTRTQTVTMPPPVDSVNLPLIIDHVPSFTFATTTGFTVEVGEPLPCGSMGSTAWFKLTLPTGNVGITADTAGSGFNTALAVYTTPALSPPGSLSLLGCNANGPASTVSFAAFGPATYYIQAGGQNGATGSLVINLHCTHDRDCDGLSDDDEGFLGTNPDVADTDGDGLSDGIEVHVYGTDPSLVDTDGDACGDGRELRLALDPANTWDFYSVPVPALLLGQPSTTDAGIGITTDVVALLLYSGKLAGSPEYEADHNSNGVRDGREYDRSPLTINGQQYPGPPDGGIGVTTDVVTMLAWSGKIC